MTYEKVVRGLVNYIENNMYSTMTDWQEIAARVAVARMQRKADGLKTALQNNWFLKEIDVFDSNGDVDVDGLIKDIREQIAVKGKLSIEFPFFGKFTFGPSDVDVLHRYILEA